MSPAHVSGAIGYEIEYNFDSLPAKVMSEEEMTVSALQLDIEVNVTMYLFFPVEQLLTRPKTPMFIPGEIVTELVLGVATTAQPEDVEPPPPPPPPGLPF
jgi:hypothetical protein